MSEVKVRESSFPRTSTELVFVVAVRTQLLESDEESPYPPFTGLEFLNTHDTTDEHPYTTAFSQFLAIGIDADIANELAFGAKRACESTLSGRLCIHSAIGNISDDFEDPLRQTAVDIFDRLSNMNYWRDSEDTDSEPDGFDAHMSE